MLSHRVIAYYGLIRNSRPLPSIYLLLRWVFALRPCMGWYREAPQFAPPVFPLRAAFRTPVDRTVAHGCSFTVRTSLRPLHRGSASTTHTAGSHVGRVTRLQSSLYATARKVAGPAPARTLTSKLSSPKVTSKRRRIYYAGIQSIPATGLTPARHVALWAANEEHEVHEGDLNLLLGVEIGLSFKLFMVESVQTHSSVHTRPELSNHSGTGQSSGRPRRHRIPNRPAVRECR